MRRLALITVASLALAAPAAAQTAGPEATRQLHEEIARADAELFDALFDRCDVARLGELVADDLEFVHDKHGRTAGSKAEFLDQIRRSCARRASGDDYSARRELVPGSMSVHVINNYGVMQMGEHRFYRLHRDKPEELVETGRFIDIWRKADGRWKLFRVISYDHRLVK